MIQYVKTNELNEVVKYPYTYEDLRLEFSNVIFPPTIQEVSAEFLSSNFIFPVEDNLNLENYNPELQKAVDDGVERNPQGDWVTKLLIVDKTVEEFEQETQHALDDLQRRMLELLDAFAQERGYDDIKSACDYAGCSIAKYDTEGTYCKNLRAETWNAFYTIVNDVKTSVRAIPSLEELLLELPTPQWPV